ncbi:hypothetical protein ACB092_M000400 [Castanea dentata]
MERLQEIAGCYPFFLKAASTYLDEKKNIKYEKLSDVADFVNSSYDDAGLTAFEVKDIWGDIKEYWKTWNQVIKLVDPDIIDWELGTITPKDERDWERILQLVPDAVIFKSKKLFLASEVHAIFNVQDSKDLKKKKKRRIEEGSSSLNLYKIEQKEVRASMLSLEKVDGLNNSLKLALFCTRLFQDKQRRDYFRSLRSGAMKLHYVEDEYKKYYEHPHPFP